MSDNDQAGESSKAAIPPHNDGPSERSKYEKNWELDTKHVELYKEKDKVYVRGARGVDPKPYKIYKVLGEAQYNLSRDGKCDGKVYRQEDIQTIP
ncbi:hypothetical protein HO173_001480 [Letharia columbiana]|uniref:Uncharacterized protein n=1 Tax=Letharia columbiana TaxID=112416 RepID=A0A8H6G5E0_9LECA|nr:uncharacterized protein HO173_001480 [Letharia columbiana]KAF6240807.1 hypothetical protein HO173_001480 [Letharia columbiana]